MTCYLDHKVFVVLRSLLRRFKCLRIYHVDLHVEDLLVDKYADQIGKSFVAVWRPEYPRIQAAGQR